MNCYEVLGINQGATKQDIQKAFRAKALLFNPETQTKVSSLLEFSRICEAYEILSNNEFKAVYDRYGEEVLKHGIQDDKEGRVGGCYSFDPRMDPLRIFKDFFSTDNPYEVLHEDAENRLLTEFENLASYEAPRKGGTKTIEFWCELEEVYKGCEKSVKYTRAILDANGDAQVEEKTLKIMICRGEEAGTSFRFENEGDCEKGALPGAVEFILRIHPHRKFSRERLNLLRVIEIPLHQALSSQPIQVDTIDGKCAVSPKLSTEKSVRKLSILIPQVVTPGHKHLIKGEGMIAPNHTKGDLIIEVKLIFPKHLTELQQSVLKTALLFPKHPSSVQQQVAAEFKAKGGSYTDGWMRTVIAPSSSLI